jgi:hypothetical protein
MESRDHRVHWDVNHMGRGLRTAQITLIICYQIELERLNIYETLTCSIPKTFCRLWMSSASSCLDISLSLFPPLHCWLCERYEWTRKWRYYYAVGHNYHGVQARCPR